MVSHVGYTRGEACSSCAARDQAEKKVLLNTSLRRFYSTVKSISMPNLHMVYDKHINTTLEPEELINPWYVTGGRSKPTADAEGSLKGSVSKNPSSALGWRVQARFIIELHSKEMALLTCIQYFLKGIGTTKKKVKQEIQFVFQ